MEPSAITFGIRTKAFIFKRYSLISNVFRVLAIWSIFEIILCSIVFVLKDKDYASNFMNGLCSKPNCNDFLNIALRGRIIVSIVSLLGILMGVSSLAAPWFLMNALGIFPLLPVIVSSFTTYMDLDTKIKQYESLYNVLKMVCKWFFAAWEEKS